MSNTYERLVQSLNVVKWELKECKDPTLNLCIKYIKDAIIEAGRLNNELEHLKHTSPSCDDDADCWCE